jgi:hypothetical protein
LKTTIVIGQGAGAAKSAARPRCGESLAADRLAVTDLRLMHPFAYVSATTALSIGAVAAFAGGWVATFDADLWLGALWIAPVVSLCVAVWWKAFAGRE